MLSSHRMEPSSDPLNSAKGKGLLAAGGIIGAILSASCCVLPLTLFSVGISGAWIGNLSALAPYHPYFVGFALLALSAGYWKIYHRQKVGCAGDQCVSTQSDRLVKVVLWLATAIVILAIAFPYITPYLLGE